MQCNPIYDHSSCGRLLYASVQMPCKSTPRHNCFRIFCPTPKGFTYILVIIRAHTLVPGQKIKNLSLSKPSRLWFSSQWGIYLPGGSYWWSRSPRLRGVRMIGRIIDRRQGITRCSISNWFITLQTWAAISHDVLRKFGFKKSSDNDRFLWNTQNMKEWSLLSSPLPLVSFGVKQKIIKSLSLGVRG